MRTPDTIRIGVSACLLGAPVRYDGGHKRDAFVATTLARHVTIVAVCPEIDIGLGVPRETLKLLAGPDGIRLVGTETGRDVTAKMQRYARKKTHELQRLGLAGYVLKANSPSCGLASARIQPLRGTARARGPGVFAAQLFAHLGLLPVEEESALSSACARDCFIERVFAYHRLQRLFARRWTIADMISFHGSEELFLATHSRRAWIELGRVLANASCDFSGS
jgi:uncharacterized protein YbbK (DUF523 family)